MDAGDGETLAIKGVSDRYLNRLPSGQEGIAIKLTYCWPRGWLGGWVVRAIALLPPDF